MALSKLSIHSITFRALERSKLFGKSLYTSKLWRQVRSPDIEDFDCRPDALGLLCKSCISGGTIALSAIVWPQRSNVAGRQAGEHAHGAVQLQAIRSALLATNLLFQVFVALAACIW
jgi:hypothetical protein